MVGEQSVSEYRIKCQRRITALPLLHTVCYPVYSACVCSAESSCCAKTDASSCLLCDMNSRVTQRWCLLCFMFVYWAAILCLPGVIRLSIHLYLFVLLAPRPKGPSLMCVVLSGCAERVLLRLLVLFFWVPGFVCLGCVCRCAGRSHLAFKSGESVYWLVPQRVTELDVIPCLIN